MQKFDTPVEQVTTPSLEALHAYSLGRTLIDQEDFVAAAPFFRRQSISIRISPWPMPHSDCPFNLAERDAVAISGRPTSCESE